MLTLIAETTGAAGIALVSMSCQDEPGDLLAVAGAEAHRFGPLGPTHWADDRFSRSGRLIADGGGSWPWESGSVVVWRSIRGEDGILSLVAFGNDPDSQSLDQLSGAAFVLAELVMARRGRADLLAQLKAERQDRAILAASLQHDLRTPLSGILGFASVLRSDGERGPEETKELLDMIVAEAEHMARMVADSLKRDESGSEAPLQLQTVDPVEVAASVAEATARARGGEIVIGVSEQALVTDRTRLTRALLNLVDNAIKYSPPGAAVRISGRRDGEHYMFVVADSGPGVPEEMVPSLFQPYTTDPHRTDGTGLGLHSVATIARELGGRVTYARRDDWTTFSLWVSANEGEIPTDMAAGLFEASA